MKVTNHSVSAIDRVLAKIPRRRIKNPGIHYNLFARDASDFLKMRDNTISLFPHPLENRGITLRVEYKDRGDQGERILDFHDTLAERMTHQGFENVVFNSRAKKETILDFIVQAHPGGSTASEILRNFIGTLIEIKSKDKTAKNGVSPIPAPPPPPRIKTQKAPASLQIERPEHLKTNPFVSLTIEKFCEKCERIFVALKSKRPLSEEVKALAKDLIAWLEYLLQNDTLETEYPGHKESDRFFFCYIFAATKNELSGETKV